ncbi:MAG: acylneuraminate cytidylyltransferase family protein [Nitrospirae bacterium]|nr:acylneuraminate cytidylyltransferase family protein [Nitrospirota bacterium]
MAPLGKKSVLVLIPARGGSKGIPHKNIVDLCGYPLLAYAIAAARKSAFNPRILVTTDDEEIARVARSFGADAPFLRPAELGQDTSPLTVAQLHALHWLREHEGYRPAATATVLPTYPFVRAKTIDQVIGHALKGMSARTVIRTPASSRLFFLEDEGVLSRVQFRTRSKRWYLGTAAAGAVRYFPSFDPAAMNEREILRLMKRYATRLRNLGINTRGHATIEVTWVEAVDIDTPRELTLARKLIASGVRPALLQ